MQLHELGDMTLNAYYSSKHYKECIKAYHDKRIMKSIFQLGQSMLDNIYFYHILEPIFIIKSTLYKLRP